MIDTENIRRKIADVKDPELGLGVVDLGLIYDIEVLDDGLVRIAMTLTTPYCPYGPQLVAQVQKAAATVEGVSRAEVNVVWEPPWNPSEMATPYAKDVLGIW